MTRKSKNPQMLMKIKAMKIIPSTIPITKANTIHPINITIRTIITTITTITTILQNITIKEISITIIIETKMKKLTK